MTLGKKLKQLRQEQNKTTSEISNLLNIGRSTLSNYENDIRRPDYDTLIKLADFYNVSVTELLGAEKETTHTNNSSSKENVEVQKLAKQIIQIYIEKGYIKDENDLTKEKREKIIKEVIEMLEISIKLKQL